MFGINDREIVPLRAGINVVKPVTIFQFEKNDKDGFTDQVYFEFVPIDSVNAEKPLTIRYWLSLPNTKNKDGGENEFFKKQMQNFNATLTQFLSGFYSKKDFDLIKAKLAKTNLKSLQDFCNLLKTHLPKNYLDRECEIILHYKKAGDAYLNVPRYASYNNGRIFSAHPARVLELSPWFVDNMLNARTIDDDIPSNYGNNGATAEEEYPDWVTSNSDDDSSEFPDDLDNIGEESKAVEADDSEEDPF